MVIRMAPYRQRWLMAPTTPPGEGGGSGGAGTGAGTGTGAGAGSGTGDGGSGGGTGGNGDGAGAGSGQQAGKTFTQAEVDALITDRLGRAQRKAEADKAKADADAEAARLRAAGEFEKLAADRQKEIDRLTAETGKITEAEAKAARYEAAIAAQLTTARAGLPAYILGLLDKMDAADQLEWLATNREAVAAGTGAENGNGGGTRPRSPNLNAGQHGRPADKQALVEQSIAEGKTGRAGRGYIGI